MSRNEFFAFPRKRFHAVVPTGLQAVFSTHERVCELSVTNAGGVAGTLSLLSTDGLTTYFMIRVPAGTTWFAPVSFFAELGLQLQVAGAAALDTTVWWVGLSHQP